MTDIVLFASGYLLGIACGPFWYAVGRAVQQMWRNAKKGPTDE